MLLSLRRLADGLIGVCAAIGSAGLVFEVALILVDVTGRYFGAPLVGAQDLAQMTMVLVVFGGMAICDRVGGHIAVDVLERVFPAWLNRFADIAAALLGAAIFAGLVWTVYQSAKLSQMLHLATNIIGLPKVWFQWAICGFAAVTAFGMALRAAELALSGRDVRAERPS